MAGPATRTSKFIVLALASWVMPHLAAAQAIAQPTVEIPIYQTAMDDGTFHYSIWIQVGHRIVEALLDTGSTGVRVLPAVVPGDLTGMPTETEFGGVLNLNGLVVPETVEIGSLSKTVPVEVIDHSGCSQDTPNCPAPRHGGAFLIAGDGHSGHGYSAIVGIGFTERSQDIPNPLEALGVNRWIVELPLPDDPQATGRLILNPSVSAQAGFKMAPAVKGADFFGCLQSKKPEQMICGPMLLDTGAPGITAITQDIQTAEIWPEGRAVSFRFRSGQTLSFDAGGQGDLSQIRVVPTKQQSGHGDTFILAGVFPFYFYNVLYDATAHKVGLKERGKSQPATPPPVQQATAEVPPAMEPAARAVPQPSQARPAAGIPRGPRELPPQDSPNTP
jgi:hypothetical protein